MKLILLLATLCFAQGARDFATVNEHGTVSQYEPNAPRHKSRADREQARKERIAYRKEHGREYRWDPEVNKKVPFHRLNTRLRNTKGYSRDQAKAYWHTLTKVQAAANPAAEGESVAAQESTAGAEGEFAVGLEAGAADDEAVEFDFGDKVLIHGLASEALNGQIGVIQGRATTTGGQFNGRFNVKLSDGIVKSIKAANLEVKNEDDAVPAAEASEATAQCQKRPGRYSWALPDPCDEAARALTFQGSIQHYKCCQCDKSTPPQCEFKKFPICRGMTCELDNHGICGIAKYTPVFTKEECEEKRKNAAKAVEKKAEEMMDDIEDDLDKLDEAWDNYNDSERQKAWRQLQAKYHPDSGKNKDHKAAAEIAFKQLTEWYEDEFL